MPSQSFFAERFFALFDSDGSSSISLEELLKALDLLIHGNETDKLRFLFQVYDVDGQSTHTHTHTHLWRVSSCARRLPGSGSIDPDELRIVLKSCLRESAISLPEEKLDDLTLALFESADQDKSGSITFEELKAELETFPEVMENLTIRWSLSNALFDRLTLFHRTSFFIQTSFLQIMLPQTVILWTLCSVFRSHFQFWLEK